MRYFSGFSLVGESELFEPYLCSGDLVVAGFSHGAQQAFEYAYASQERIDRLILLSPAFFQTQKPSFVRTQLRYFEAGREAYIAQFLANVAYPATDTLQRYLQVGSTTALRDLLTYRWEEPKLHTLLARGTTIEVFLGQEDKIVDASEAFAFFSALVPTYLIKGAGHLLKATHA